MTSPLTERARAELRPRLLHWSRVSLLLCLFLLFPLLLLSGLSPTCALTVHLVPHTHDDVGWLKTVS
jgi:hypothetical protein